MLDAVRLYPTPTASVYGSTNNGSPGDGRETYATKGTLSLNAMALRGRLGTTAGQLNPDWVETLMGFPIGWTDGPLARASLPTRGSRRGSSLATGPRSDEPGSARSETRSCRK